MPYIFITIIFVVFLPLSVWADSSFQLNLTGFDKSAFFRGVAVIQFITVMICFLTGPFQFIPKLYRKNPMLHFALGNVYTMVILLLAGPATLLLAFGRNSRVEVCLLAIAAVLLWWCTRKGIFYISEKRWQLHLKWMMYSYAFILSITYFLVIQQLHLGLYGFAGMLIFPLTVFILEKNHFTRFLLKRFTGR